MASLRPCAVVVALVALVLGSPSIARASEDREGGTRRDLPMRTAVLDPSKGPTMRPAPTDESIFDRSGKTTDPDDRADRPNQETEIAGVPIVGGSTDIGVQLGVAGALARVGGGFRPYRWKIDFILSASLKGGPEGTEVAQQSHDLRLDIPGALNGKLRIMPGIFVEQTINAGYFGIGNDTTAVTDENGEVGRRYQYMHRELRSRVNLRWPIRGALSAMTGIQLRYVNPEAYAESRLAIDSRARRDDGAPYIYGLQPLGIAIVSAGALYDTRDNEIAPGRGAFDLYGLRVAAASPTSSDVRWGGANIILRRYVPLFGPVTFAGRLFVDAMIGHVPYYDLSQAGAFVPIDLPGGPQGIRGVPNGRYSGLIKAVGNVEARAFAPWMSVLGQQFRLGGVMFFDAGRVFRDYTFSDNEGKVLGLKFGTGGGVYVQWGTAALFRVEVAYSPDASAANPGFPVGIYAADSVMF